MGKSGNKILICGGCSFTGGGGFDDPRIFRKEFPNTDISLLSDEIKFKNFIRDILWPEQLKKLSGHDLVYNCSIGGRGTKPTLDFLKDIILSLKQKNNSVKIDVIYQIPESAREDVWYDEYSRPVCLLTNFDDNFEPKKYFYTNFFNDEYSFFNQIQELYRFKKFCKLLNINVHLFSWDEKFTKDSMEILKLKNKMISHPYEIQNKKFWHSHIGNVLEYPRVNLDEQLDFLNVLDFDGHGMNWYAIEQYDNFTFEQKYKKDGIVDTHASKEGMQIVAKILFEKIFNKIWKFKRFFVSL